MNKMIKLVMVATLALSVYSCGEKKQDEQDLPAFSKVYNSAANPEDDLNYAVSIAKEENKRIFMMVGGDWCVWCRGFDKFLKEKSKVSEYLYKNFVVVKVYYGKGNYNAKFLSGFPRVIATPHFYVLESDGKTLLSQGSEVFEKGRSYDQLKLMSFLQKWTKKTK